MRCAGCHSSSRQGDFNRRVLGENIDAAVREEILSGLRAAENLEQDRDGRRSERMVVDVEVGAVLQRS